MPACFRNRVIPIAPPLRFVKSRLGEDERRNNRGHYTTRRVLLHAHLQNRLSESRLMRAVVVRQPQRPVNGTSFVKIYLQPNASIDGAKCANYSHLAEHPQTIASGIAPSADRRLQRVNCSYSAVRLSGNGMTESQLNDIALNFLRMQLVAVPGAAVPYPYGGKFRHIMVTLNPGLLQSKGLSPNDVLTAPGNEQLILPGATAKIGQFEYDVDANVDLRKISDFNIDC
jgi:multidrug efflux pump subunit AcrB